MSEWHGGRRRRGRREGDEVEIMSRLTFFRKKLISPPHFTEITQIQSIRMQSRTCIMQRESLVVVVHQLVHAVWFNEEKGLLLVKQTKWEVGNACGWNFMTRRRGAFRVSMSLRDPLSATSIQYFAKITNSKESGDRPIAPQKHSLTHHSTCMVIQCYPMSLFPFPYAERHHRSCLLNGAKSFRFFFFGLRIHPPASVLLGYALKWR